MAEVKWIKLATQVFDNRKIRQIEKMPDGDSVIVIWFKLLCLAGNINDGGMVYFTREMPYTEEMLSTEFNRPIQTVRLALTLFQQYKMIDIIDSVYYISSWEKYQNVEGLEKIREQTRKRVAKHRENQRLEMSTLTCQYCGGNATGYDHIIATARGGNDTEQNKVECCIECNRIKNDKPIVDFLNSNRGRINDELVKNNVKLSKHVTLCNVTNCYIVTQGNATDIDKEIDKEDINTYSAFFEKMWKLYPNKKGKGQISDSKKKKIAAIGEEEFIRAIDRYKAELEKDKDWRKPQNGSTFFNSGYVDYLDANYEPSKDTSTQNTNNRFNRFPQRDYTNEQYKNMESKLLSKN